jgi:hypothetical protein
MTTPEPPATWSRDMPRHGLASQLPAPGDVQVADLDRELAMTAPRAEILRDAAAGKLNAQAGDAYTGAGSKVSTEVHLMGRAGWIRLGGTRPGGGPVRFYELTDAGRRALATYRAPARGRR